MLSPVSHLSVIELLTDSLGFRIVKDEGLQTELRKGRIHVIVRTYRDDRGTVIRFHEDHGQGRKHLALERSRSLLRFKQLLEAALEKKKQADKTG